MDGLVTGLNTTTIITGLMTPDTQRISKLNTKKAAVAKEEADYVELSGFYQKAASSLKAAATSTTVDDATAALAKFVDSYNESRARNGASRAYKQELGAFKSEVATNQAAQDVTSMAQLGVRTNRDGSLSFDASQAKATLTNEATAANAKTFLATASEEASDSRFSASVNSKVASLQAKETQLDLQIEQKQAAFDIKYERLVNQYAKVESNSTISALGNLFSTTG